MIPNEEKIKSIKENLFYRSQAAICDYEQFDWHNYKGNIDTDQCNSSQAIAIDFWGSLKCSPFKDQIINNLFSKNCSKWKIKFEYTDRNLMSEKRSTQIDVIIESEPGRIAIIVESKFKERDGGHCSQLKKTKKGLNQCNGLYKDQINRVNNIESKCALSGKGIRYWDYIPLTMMFDNNGTYNPCPFKNGEFQWMRNICFAEAYATQTNEKTECYLVYYKSDKCPISRKVDEGTYLGNLKDKLRNLQTFKPKSYNELLSQIISYLDSISLEKRRKFGLNYKAG